MQTSYGPWATKIDVGNNPRLSAFWRRRLTRLPGLSRDNPVLTRSAALALFVIAIAIPPKQVADRYLYIELDVSHPDYAPRRGFGYALSMIRKNEKIGGRPFFERVELVPGEPITGTVVTPDGKPAAGIKVLAFSMADRRDFEGASFAPGSTGESGAFRSNGSHPGDMLLTK